MASAGFRFGTVTSLNPVYALRDPADEHASRALLNLIDAVGQGIDLAGNPVDLPIAEPFWAIAFPDAAETMIRTDTTATDFVGLVAQWSDTIYLAVEDQYGNPVSNIPVTFQVEPLQTNAACSNELPADLRVNAAVFDNLSVDGEPACGGHPVLGSCGGAGLVKRTSYLGTSAGVIEGNVVAATYTVAVTAPDLAPLAYTYTQNWTIDGSTGACDTPDRFRVFSNFLTDSDGRNVQAAAVGELFDWPIDFWIDYYEPEPRTGDPPYYAGGGQWWAVCGSDLGLAVSNGGSASAPVQDPVTWSYSTKVTTGFAPGFNEVSAAGSSFSFCANGTPLARVLNEHVNDVWGLETEITDFEPEVVVLTPQDTLAETLTISYQIEPPDYHAYSVEISVLDVEDQQTTLWPGSSRSDQGATVLPRGFELEVDHQHLARVVLNRAHPAQVVSADEELPLRQPILRDVTTFLRVSQELDLVNRTTCAENDVFSFGLNHPAAVTLSFVRDTPTGPGDPEIFINNVVLGEGDHSFTFSPSSATAADFTLLPGSYTFELIAVSQIHGHSRDRDRRRGVVLRHARRAAGRPRHGQGGGSPRRSPRAEPRGSRRARPRGAAELRAELLVGVGGARAPRPGLDPQLARAGRGDAVRRAHPHRHRGFGDALHPGRGRRVETAQGLPRRPAARRRHQRDRLLHHRRHPLSIPSGDDPGRPASRRVASRFCRRPERQPDEADLRGGWRRSAEGETGDRARRS